MVLKVQTQGQVCCGPEVCRASATMGRECYHLVPEEEHWRASIPAGWGNDEAGLP